MVVEVSGKLLKEYDGKGYNQVFHQAFTGIPEEVGFDNGLSAPQPHSPIYIVYKARLINMLNIYFSLYPFLSPSLYLTAILAAPSEAHAVAVGKGTVLAVVVQRTAVCAVKICGFVFIRALQNF